MNLVAKLGRKLKSMIEGRAPNTSVTNVTRPSKRKQPPKIVCVSHDALFYGAQLLMLHIVQALKLHLGFQVTIVLLGSGPLRAEFEQAGEVVDFTDPSWRETAKPKVLHARQRAIKRLYREGARHAICNTSVSGNVVQMLKEEGFQVVVLVHELPNLIREFRLDSAVKAIGQWADRVVFPAAYVRDRFLPVAGLDPARTVIRPQGLYRPNPYRHAKPKCRAHLINEMGVTSSARLILAAGPGDQRKGLDIFCQVALQVVQHMPEAHFVWIGDDTTELALECKAWVQAEGIAGNVHFTGVLKQPDLYLQHIAGADLYLMTSREDPYPSVVLDAMEVAVPIVWFNGAGGFAELLIEGVGVLVPFEDRAAMAAAVNGLLVDATHSDRMGEEGQRIIDKRFYFPDYVYDLIKLVGCPRSKITVVVPSFNYARYLPTRLASIFSQTYRPYEIIFLDDHSSDDSVAIAEALLAESGIPDRVLVNDVNRGCYSQWLTGIEMAKGDLVWIAEADDESESTFLEELVVGFEDPDVVLAYSQSRKINQDGTVAKGNYLDYTDELSKSKWLSPYCRTGRDEIEDTLAIKNTIPNASAVLMKTPDLSGIQDRLQQHRNAGDWVTYVHILETGSIYCTPKVLNSHRVHIGGLTQGGNALQHMSEIIQVQEYVRERHVLPAVTVAKIEKMRQFTYEYLKLNESGPPTYLDHPALQDILIYGTLQ